MEIVIRGSPGDEVEAGAGAGEEAAKANCVLLVSVGWICMRISWMIS